MKKDIYIATFCLLELKNHFNHIKITNSNALLKLKNIFILKDFKIQYLNEFYLKVVTISLIHTKISRKK